MRLVSSTIAALLTAILASPAVAQPAASPPLTGQKAFGDWRNDAPGVRRLIRPEDLPAPYATSSARNSVRVVKQPPDARLRVPLGFEVSLLLGNLSGPRLLRTAPNGDIFVAESQAGRIRALRLSADGASVAQNSEFASIGRPFGIAFYPAGDDPEWVYVATTDSVVRFPYRSGDLKARARPEVVVSGLPTGGHSTRDIVFSKDGRTMFVSVGSASNVAEGVANLTGAALKDWEAKHGVGAAYGAETDRAAVLAFDPNGHNKRVFAAGIRNCVGMALDDGGTLWCSVNERDGLGDDLVPDYVTRVKEGGFYGWPWYYMGGNEDPRHKGARPDLKTKVIVPDVLIQPHSASLQMTFYDGQQFPPDYRGSAFAAEHGSWNRGSRTGYKIIRIVIRDGVPTGEYEDFVTGFGIDATSVWGRPVGVTVAKDGALLFSDDGNGTIWRVGYNGPG